MTKQEEIREDVARTFYEASDVSKTIAWLDLPKETKDSFFYKGDNLLYRLQDLYGVVIKVKCPYCKWTEFKEDDYVGMTPCDTCNSTGYIFEPLIKEVEK